MPTTRGWAAFAAGLGLYVGARFAGSPDLHMVSVGIIAMPFLAMLFVQWNRISIDVRRQLSASHVYPGTRTVVTLKVRNEGPGTAPFLLLEDALPAELGKPARVVVTGIPAKSDQSVSYSILCRRRGRFQIGPLTTDVTDPFGLARIRHQTMGHTELVVYPRVDDVGVPSMVVAGAGAGESAARQLHRSVAEFYTMREYVTGDDLRRIHWPSVARTGQLMIRQDEATRRSTSVVFLDTRAGGVGGQVAESFETMVSAAASIGRAFIRAGFSLHVATTDAAPKPLAEEQFLEFLSGISPTRTRTSSTALTKLRSAALTDSMLAVVSAPPVAEELPSVIRAGAGYGKRLAVFVHPLDLEAVAGRGVDELRARADAARAALKRSGWDVVVLAPKEKLGQLWRTSSVSNAVLTAVSSRP